jgi:hypothetical protein
METNPTDKPVGYQEVAADAGPAAGVAAVLEWKKRHFAGKAILENHSYNKWENSSLQDRAWLALARVNKWLWSRRCPCCLRKRRAKENNKEVDSVLKSHPVPIPRGSVRSRSVENKKSAAHSEGVRTSRSCAAVDVKRSLIEANPFGCYSDWDSPSTMRASTRKE